jgi:hypothetical protein
MNALSYFSGPEDDRVVEPCHCDKNKVHLCLLKYKYCYQVKRFLPEHLNKLNKNNHFEDKGLSA